MEKAGDTFHSERLQEKGQQKRDEAGGYGGGGSY